MAAGATSLELVRSEGVQENPVLTRRPEGYVMLTSEGDWTRCGYATRWLSSPTLLDWSAATAGTLLDNETTPLCGPGGADLVEVSGGRTLVFLHGWTCRGSDLPCAGQGQVGPQARAARDAGDVRRRAGLGRWCARGHRLAPGALRLVPS